MLPTAQSLISSQLQLQLHLFDYVYICVFVYVYVHRGTESELPAGLVQCRAESKADSAQLGEVNFPQRSDQGPVWTG